MSEYLLDTQIWLWLQVEPERVDHALVQRLADPATTVYLSAASAWEIAIKYRLGKLRLPDLPSRYLPARMRQTGTRPVAIETEHALQVADLPDHHRDPFDRMIIAQARSLQLPVVSADPLFARYDVQLVFP